MAYTVLAWWRARPDTADTVARKLSELIPLSRAEPGCLAYDVHRHVDDATDFFLHEVYADKAAYEAHQHSDHFRGLAQDQALPLLAERRREFYVPLDPTAPAGPA